MKLKGRTQKISGNKGITIIALAVTIIVLTILASITINAVFSDNGLIRKSQKAKELAEETITAEEKSVNKLVEEHTGVITADKDKLEVFIKIEEVKGGEVFTKKTVIVDSVKNKIVVPAGFKIASDSGYTVEQGIVIEDVNASTDLEVQGSQFVWIPVGKFIKDNGTQSNEIILGRYTFSTSAPGTPTLQQAAYTADNSENYKNSKIVEKYFDEFAGGYREGVASSDANALNASSYNLKEWVNSVKENGGFYIGRYEASFASGTSLNNYKVATKVSTGYSEESMSYSQNRLWNFITQLDASKVSINTYANSNSVKSDLMNSYAWDTALVFIQETGNKNFANQKGIDINTNLVNTGTGQDEVCKINDISSNLSEWTTEFCIISTTPCTGRGGNYFSSNVYMAFRGASDATIKGNRVRVSLDTLYVD